MINTDNQMSNRKAFTLIELIITMAIIAILSVVVTAKIQALIDKSKQGYTKGELATMRSVLQVYYSDNQIYPKDNLSSLVPKYISTIPSIKLPNTNHPETSYVKISSDTFVEDTGNWLYVNDENSQNWGKIIIDCAHQDLKGNIWSSY